LIPLKNVNIFNSVKEVFHIVESGYNSEFITNLNYCGYIVHINLYEKLGYHDVVEFHNSIPFLKEVIIYYKTDPNLKLEKINDTESKYSDAIYFDRYSTHLHKVNHNDKAIARNNTCGSINLPLINCNKNSTTYFYRLKSGQPQVKDYLTRGDDCEFEVIEKNYLSNNCANLIRTEQWHSITNKTNSLRVVANIDFRWHVTWDDIQYIMSDYIQ